MEKIDFAIKGMSCATCALNIENVMKEDKDIKNFSVNFSSEVGSIETENTRYDINKLNKRLKPLGYEIILEEDDIQRTQLEEKKIKLKFILPISGAIFLWMTYELLSKFFTFLPQLMIDYTIMNWVLLLLSTIVLLSAGRPFIRGIGIFLKGEPANMDTLIGIGTITAYTYSTVIFLNQVFNIGLNLQEQTFFDAVVVVIGFVYLGKYLEYRSKYKTGEAIKQLATLQAKTAIVIKDGKLKEIPISEIRIGDTLLIKPGAKIPVDGQIIDGNGVVDMSMLTGEPIPQDKSVGDTVYEGTINTQGSFSTTAMKIGEETALANIINIVRQAQNSKAPIQKTVDKISSIFVPTILIIAFVSLTIWILVDYLYLGNQQAIPLGISSFVSVLVIACPCALGLATPTAIIVGVGKAAQNGILIKNAESFEKLNKVNTVIFDKTGTLTQGRPKVQEITYSDKDSNYEDIIYSLENLSEHPLANAITQYLKSPLRKEIKVKDFINIDGKGISGIIGKKKYYIVKPSYAKDLAVKIDNGKISEYEKKGYTVVLLVSGKSLLATISISDNLKERSKDTISHLKSLGINTVMITGDNEEAARNIAQQAGVDEFYYEVLPSEKGEYVKKYQEKGNHVAMIGDGINDAPALALADASMAMATGTEIAMSTSDITLLGGDIEKVLTAFEISKATLRTIKQNLFWALIYNTIGIPIAAGLLYPIWGILLNPIFAGMAMAFSSVSVVTNSLRLKFLKISNE